MDGEDSDNFYSSEYDEKEVGLASFGKARDYPVLDWSQQNIVKDLWKNLKVKTHMAALIK